MNALTLAILAINIVPLRPQMSDAARVRTARIASAFAALGTGIAAWILGAHVLHLPNPYVTSLAAAFAAYVIPAWFLRDREVASIQGSAA